MISFFFFIYSILYFLLHSEKIMSNTLLNALFIFIFFLTFLFQIFYSKRLIDFLRKGFVFPKTGYYEPIESPFVYGIVILLAVLLSMGLLVFHKINLSLPVILIIDIAVILRGISTRNLYLLWIIPFSLVPVFIRTDMDTKLSVVFLIFATLFLIEGLFLYSKNIKGIKNGKYKKDKQNNS